MRTVSIFLVTVALITGMAGCAAGIEYNLTISSSEGGEVTTPGDGASTYDKGEVVNLVAEAEEGYRFVNWTGDVNDIANVEDATTTITMNDDYFINAKFAVEPQYILITTSTKGGEVTDPGEGVFSYDEGTVVNLVSTPDPSYHLIDWTGNVSTIADVEDATTTITMNGDYFIIANFALGNVTGCTLTVSPDVECETACYTVNFTTSAVGGLAANIDSIVITFPSTTGISGANATVNTAVATNITPVGMELHIITPVSINASQNVSVVVCNISNPKAGDYKLYARTMWDACDCEMEF